MRARSGRRSSPRCWPTAGGSAGTPTTGPISGLDTAQLFEFIGATQPDGWTELLGYYGNDPDAAQRASPGGSTRRSATTAAACAPQGVKDRGVHLRVAYFKPNLVTSETVLGSYRANLLTVVKELAYATKQADQGNRLDLTLFLDGIPVATAELKNRSPGRVWSRQSTSTVPTGTRPS